MDAVERRGFMPASVEVAAYAPLVSGWLVAASTHPHQASGRAGSRRPDLAPG
jgi:hypothetical protein